MRQARTTNPISTTIAKDEHFGVKSNNGEALFAENLAKGASLRFDQMRLR
jgi:hypothetical protein